MRGGAVARHGVGFMDSLNAGRFASGGPVSGRAVQAVAQQTGALAQVLGESGLPPALWSAGLGSGDSSAFTGIGGMQSGFPVSLQVARALGSTAEHTLNLVTHAGQFSVAATDETIETIRASSLGAKLTSTGTRPSWYS